MKKKSGRKTRAQKAREWTEQYLECHSISSIFMIPTGSGPTGPLGLGDKIMLGILLLMMLGILGFVGYILYCDWKAGLIF